MESLDIILNSLTGMVRGFFAHLPQIAFAIVVLIVAWVVSKFVDRIMVRMSKEKTEHRSLQMFFRKLASFGVWAFAIVVAAMPPVSQYQAGRSPGGPGTRVGRDRICLQGYFREFHRRHADPAARTLPAQ